ncbi:MAG: peptidylprolyl isomerase, partial [Phycisphaerales bacterium]|nr:peptidylprolyl isomerase [Phycisphaerales bacterium]
MSTCLLGIVITATGIAAGGQPAPSSPSTQPATETDADLLELKELQARFRNARTHTDLPAMRMVRTDAHEYCARYPYMLDGQLLEAQICAYLGDLEAADALYSNILTAEPTRVRDGWEWASIHATTNPERTIQILRDLLVLLPDRPAYALALYEMLEKHDPARVDLDFERLSQEQTASIIIMTLVDMVGTQDVDRSVAFAQRLHELHPEDVEVTFLLARRLRRANLYTEAIELIGTLDDALRMRPDIGLLLADCLYMDQQIRPSIAQLLALEDNNDPDYPQENRDRDYRLSMRPRMIQAWADEQAIREAQANSNNPIVRLIIDGKPVTLELYATNAPVTVANFLALCKAGFYEGSPFHNVQVGFISQGGVPRGETFPSYADAGYTVADESELANARFHFKGSIVMTRIGKDKQVGSQFYITHAPTHHLHGTDPVFGHVTEGMDVIHAMRGHEHIDRAEIINPGDVDDNFDVL